MIPRTCIHFFFALSLILCTLNLCVQCWSSNVFLAEFNEEVEQVLEDDLSVVVSFTLMDTSRNTSHFLYSQSELTQPNSSYKAPYFFEIDSPPPEMIEV